MSYSEPDESRVIIPAGRLDAAAAPGLQQKITHLLARQNAIVVDLASVPYLTSSILRVLLAGRKSARRAGGDLVLCSIQPQVLHIIEMVGLDHVFSIYESQAEALQALSSLPRAGVAAKEKP